MPRRKDDAARELPTPGPRIVLVMINALDNAWAKIKAVAANSKAQKSGAIIEVLGNVFYSSTTD